MNIHIRKSIFDAFCSDADRKNMHNMLFYIVERGYSVTMGSNLDSYDFEKVDNEEDRRLLEELFSNSINTCNIPDNPYDCTMDSNGCGELELREFSLDEINEYIGGPAVIILENGTNDGHFIRAIEKWFDQENDFEKLLSEYKVLIDNGGGNGGVIGRLNYWLSIHRNIPKFLRCLVIVDSDKRFPSDNSNVESQEKDSAFVISKGCLYYVLKKRALESYMPNEVFEKNKAVFGEGWVNAYLHLSEEQKDYYYTAMGFKKDIPDRKTLPDCKLTFDMLQNQGIKDLFKDISEANFNYLLNAPNIPGDGSFKSKFPAFFTTSPDVYKDSLKKRVAYDGAQYPNELEDISSLIRQIL